MPSIAVSLRFALPVFACALATACHRGEKGRLGFELEGLVDRTYDFESGERVLVGTRICPQFVWWSDGQDRGHYVQDPQDRASLRACYEEDIDDEAKIVQGCLVFEKRADNVEWELEADPECSLGPVEDDQLRFEVIEASDELTLGFDDWRARALETNPLWGDVELIGLAPGSEPDELRDPADAPHRAIAGELDVISLRLDDPDGQVFWSVVPGAIGVLGEGIEVVEPNLDAGDLSFPGELALRIDDGAVGLVKLDLPGGVERESPALIGVSVDSAASLDLIAARTSEGEPVAARAVVRNEQGEILHAAPIEWDVIEGAIGVDRGHLHTQARTADYALLLTSCEAPPTAQPVVRHAVLRARLGELEDTVRIEWTDAVEVGNDFQPHPSCLFAEEDDEPDDGPDEQDGEPDDEGDVGLDDGPPNCACTSTDTHGRSLLLGLLSLLGIGFVRARRRGRS